MKQEKAIIKHPKKREILMESLPMNKASIKIIKDFFKTVVKKAKKFPLVKIVILLPILLLGCISISPIKDERPPLMHDEGFTEWNYPWELEHQTDSMKELQDVPIQFNVEQKHKF